MFRFLFLLILAIHTASCVNSQNLVHNGSFEELTNCLDDCEDPPDPSAIASGWFSATLQTPEGFSPCNFSTANQACSTYYSPDNFKGYQYASDGDNYAGYAVGIITSDSVKAETYTEYIASRLEESLKKKNYCISYGVNTGVNPYFRRAQLPYTVYAVTTETGVFFSKEHTIEYTYSVYPHAPQVRLTSDQNQYLEDTLTWESVEGFYRAEGDEAYITIGNFVPIADLVRHVKTVNMTPQQLADYTGGAECYQYIDNVELIEIPKLVVTADTVLKGSDGLVIGCSTPADAYEWFKGDTLTPIGNSDSILVFPQEQTNYYLKATQCKLVSWDTVRVYITGISELPDVDVSLSNTLTAESFSINYTGYYKPELEAELFNSVGQLVRRFQVTESVDVSVGDLAVGVYYCRLRSSGVPVLTEKVVKVR